jgi:hypothetical protein
MKLRLLMALTIAALCFASVPFASAAPVTVDFDSIAATCCYGDVIPNTGRGPQLTFGILQINNGVVMDNSGWNNLATTAPNLYGTSDYAALNDGSLLPGNIDMIFSSPVSNLGFDLINGFGAAAFTTYAFDSNGNILGFDIENLNCFGCGGEVAHVAFGFGGISEIAIISGQPTGSIDFAVDTITYNPVPEPGTLMLLGTGLAGLWSQRKRFFS